MKFSQCDIPGVWVVEPTPFVDERGHFARAWCQREFAENGIDFTPVQANVGFSLRKGTIRGLHYQMAPALEAKLVSCTLGSVFDVVVDCRPDSPTYRSWVGIHLSVADGRMMYVPEGCAHGCQSTEDNSEIHYMTSAPYSPTRVRGVRFDDPALGINWPLPVSSVSEQDRNWPLFEK